MKYLHESIIGSAKEMTVKEGAGFRLRLEKWEATAPKGLFTINLVQESLDKEGDVTLASTYNFNMTKEDLQALAHGLLA